MSACSSLESISLLDSSYKMYLVLPSTKLKKGLQATNTGAQPCRCHKRKYRTTWEQPGYEQTAFQKLLPQINFILCCPCKLRVGFKKPESGSDNNETGEPHDSHQCFQEGLRPIVFKLGPDEDQDPAADVVG